MSYGKVHDVFWDDDKIEALSDRAALLAMFLITGPHRNAVGCFRLGIGAICDLPRFGVWGIEGVSVALSELVGMGFIVRDDRTGWTFIRNALKHDPIASPKGAIHALGLIDRVPRNTEVYQALFGRILPQLEQHAKVLEGKAGWPIEAPSDTPTHTPSKDHSKVNRSPSPFPEPSPLPKQKPPIGGSSRAKPGLADLDPAEFRTLADQERRDVDRELANFRDWCAKTGRQFKDYPAAFRHWLRSEYGRAPPGKANDAAATEARLRRHFEQMERDHGPEAMGGGEVVPLADAARLRSAEERGR